MNIIAKPVSPTMNTVNQRQKTNKTGKTTILMSNFMSGNGLYLPLVINLIWPITCHINHDERVANANLMIKTAVRLTLKLYSH